MIDNYIIKAIKHSGRKGVRGTNCDDIKYDGLINYKCQIDIDQIQQFKPYKFKVFSPAYEEWRTSEVLTAIVISKDNKVILEIETVNTIYIFERINDDFYN